MAKKSTAGEFRVVSGRVKGLVISVHILFLLSAMAIIGLTVYVNYIETRDLSPLDAKSMVISISRLFYTAAGLRVVASGIGLKGACKQHTPPLIVSYAIFITLIAVISIVAGSSGIITAVQTTELRNTLVHHMEHYERPVHKGAQIMDNLQRKNKCCGVVEYKDWQKVTFGRTTLRTPPSCCLPNMLVYQNGTRMKPGVDEYDLCGQNVLPEDPDAGKLVYTRGCLEIVSAHFRKYLNITGVYVLTMGFVDVIIGLVTIRLIVKKRI